MSVAIFQKNYWYWKLNFIYFQVIKYLSIFFQPFKNIKPILCFWITEKQVQFSTVQSLSYVWLFVTPWIAARQASLSITNSWSSLRLMSISDAIQASHPLSSPFPPAPNSSQHQGLFQWVDSSHEVAKKSTGVSASTSVLPMNTQDWSPLGWTGWISLQSKGLSESSLTPQFKSINSSVLSFLHSPTLASIHDHWKTIALTRRTFVGKVISLLFNMLSRLVVS